MPDFDLQGRIQSVMQRVQDLRPNILPNLQSQMASRRGPILGRITGQATPGGVRAQVAWPGPKDFPAHGPATYRGDLVVGNVPTLGKGYRVTT